MKRNFITFRQNVESAKDATQLLDGLVNTEAEYNGSARISN